MRRVRVLITGRSREDVESAHRMIAENPACESEVKIIVNGHSNPLYGVNRNPDLLLLCDLHGRGELEALTGVPAEDRPPVVVFGTGDDPAAMRMALKAGARDYLTLPLQKDEIDSIIRQIADELDAQSVKQAGDLHVFVNGKGGSGATFLATNVAHGLASSKQKVTLVDLDLQFAGLCRYLDLSPSRDLLDALNALDDMDEIAAEAFTVRHESGLRLLSSSCEKLHMHSDLPVERCVALLNAYKSFNDFVIVDLPRHVDLLTASVLESADRISVVTQQSFPHLHDTARLLQILRDELHIGNERITVIVNRYSTDSPIMLKDIENALRAEDIVKIPNHYKLTAESVNTGIPLAEVARKAPVAKGLKELYQRIGGLEESSGSSAARTLQNLFRR